MNKQLIITYFEEFKHWLNGGDIIVTFTNNGWMNGLSFSWSGEYQNTKIKYIIINDEYVEFRKALAEGKTIQIAGLNPIAHPTIYENSWEDMVETDFTKDLILYRIKPEEPQFKVGDWVRIVNCNLVKNQKEVFCIDFIDDKNNCFGFNSDTEYCNMNYLELWKPKPNEWIILESNINDYAFIAIKYNSVALMSERCQPFIGELPTRLKD